MARPAVDAGAAQGSGAGTAPVAVVIPCFRQAHFVGEAIRSSLAQIPRPAEIVVVDDGSPDDVAAAVAAVGDRRVRLIRRGNGGLSVARNTGLAATAAPFLVFLDADDRLLSGALAAGLACLAEHRDAAFVWGGYRNIDEIGRPMGRPVIPTPGPLPFVDLLGGNIIGMHAAVMYRRGPLALSGGFDESLRACEDYDLYLRLARHHRVICQTAVVADYRRHAAGMSRDFDRLIDAGLRVLERHAPAADAPAAWSRAYRAGRRRLIGLNLKRSLVQGLLALGRGRTDEARVSLATVARHARSLMTAGSWDDPQRASR